MRYHFPAVLLSLACFSGRGISCAEEKPVPPIEAPEVIAAREALLAKIGTWDGKTAQARLEGPYEDRLQQQIPFGQRSFYLTPWRSYMDTWAVERFQNCLGVAVNGVNAKEVEAVATMLAEAGIRHVRMEIGWGSFRYDKPDERQGNGGECPVLLKTYRDHGIRPLILLNGNSGAPCPMQQFQIKLKADAEIGATEIEIDNLKQVKEGYTGLRGQAYQTGFPVILKADPATGKCQLSAPLLKPIKAGPLNLCTLKFKPFGGTVFEDGTPNPAAQETSDGWMQYVAGICKLAKDALGTQDAPDAGFDLEVWNEYTFGSQYLDEKNYYVPARKFKEPLVYTNHGRSAKGSESILQRTVDFVNNPANQCTGVKVISGFANQRPWDNGTELWPGQAGFSRHYYCGIRTEGAFNGLDGFLYPGNDKNSKQDVLNALGSMTKSPFIPTLKVSLPETWMLGYKTELMTREVQPFPGPMNGHGRYTHNGDGHHAEVWMTEYNEDRQPWANELKTQLGDRKDDPKLIDLLHAIAAKVTLRAFVFLSHKGLSTITMYNAKEGDTTLAVIPSVFFKELQKAEYKLTDDVRKFAGPQLNALGNVSRHFKEGTLLQAPRKLEVSAIIEHKPRLMFQGDGTREHPDRYNRDDFACLPFQLSADTFQIGYYVVGRNVVHAWRPEKDVLDPQRYIMPDQAFDLTLSNLRGTNAKVSAWDPYTNQDVPVQVLDGKENSLTVRLTTTDYPRFIRVQEETHGPQIIMPKLEALPDGKALLTFKTNLPCKPKITRGLLPLRDKDGLVELPEGLEHRFEIPSLGENCGVRIRVEANARYATWPIWDHDTAGVSRWSKRDKSEKSAPVSALYIPLLPPGSTVIAFEIKKFDGLAWSTEGASRTLKIGDGEDALRVQLKAEETPPEELVKLLPETSVLDRRELSKSTWSGQPAWRAEFTLDPVAHPGLKETRHLYYLLPYQKGVLSFNAIGTEKGFEKHKDALKKALESIAFTPQ